MSYEYNENFYYKNGQLYIDNVNCQDIIDNYKGPVVVYSENRIKSNAKSIEKAFLSNYPNCKFYFAYKACYIPGILDIIKNCGFSAEVTSSYEYKMAKKNKVANIVWNSPAKSLDELIEIVKDEVLVNVDSISEVELLNELAKENNVILNIGMRICPNVTMSSSYIGRDGKLGIDVESGHALSVCEQIVHSSNLKMSGIHSHMSVKNMHANNHIAVLEAVVDFAKAIKNKLNIKLDYISTGGGFAARNYIEKNGYTIDMFAEQMCNVLRKLDYMPTFILEPGRYIVDDCAISIGKIICKKVCNETTWWITDMCTNYLLSFADREFEVMPVILNNNEKLCINVGDRTSSFTGVINRNILIQNQNVNDFIAAKNCGSYTFSCAQNFMYPMTNFFLIVKGEIYEILHKNKTEDEYIEELYS